LGLGFASVVYESSAGLVRGRIAEHAPPASVVRLPVARRSIAATIEGAARRSRSAFPELDCIRDRLSIGVIAAAERRALSIGTGADRVLIAHGVIDEDSYAMALARWLGWSYETFERSDRACCPLSDSGLVKAASTGLIPFIVNGQLQFVIAPRSVRQLLNYAEKNPGVRFRITSQARLNRFIADAAGAALGARAAESLRDRWPDLSSGVPNRRSWIALWSVLALFITAWLTIPGPTIALTETTLAAFFLAWLALRLFGCFIPAKRGERLRLTDRSLPVYTIIVALYREACSVAELVASLRSLDYPPEKLDIKLVIEPDDDDTWAALQGLGLAAPFEVIVAPDAGPRTKPKALNAALPFAKGTFTVIYDAEDRPEPDQLRRALERFLTETDDVACVQARLTIDNTNDGWLARLFTAEYAAQFDLFLPGLARMQLPLPLGGSSNHFCTEVLREIGAWDPYNVTEDADLGMRLARFGYRSAMIESTTYEEAPARLRPWIRQRTRWFKGWMQTWMVHMRHPIRLMRQLGIKSFLTFQLVVGGNVLAALIHPVFAGIMLYALAADVPLFGVNGIPRELTWAFMATLAAGYLVTVVVGLHGLKRRGLLTSAWWLGLVIIHWLLLSLAAWRAAFQLVLDPHRWEKTEHGLAQSSRLARMTRRMATPAPMNNGKAATSATRRDARA
jgi:cellulose synthase/poly-beta-1,6-N-acetylglucosamine synthase-like glycosyltransferase